MLRSLFRYVRQVASTAYGWTIVVFFVVQVLFLFAPNSVLFAWILYKGEDLGMTAMLMLSIHGLVILNTLIYLWDAISAYGGSGKGGGQGRFRAAALLLIAAVILSVTMMKDLVDFLRGRTNRDTVSWGALLEVNEWIVLGVFLFFVIADLLLLQQLDSRLKAGGGGDEHLLRERTKAYLFLVACDVPGFVGLVLIAVMSHVMKANWSIWFWAGFTAGATALHIVFSQVVLAVVAASCGKDGVEIPASSVVPTFRSAPGALAAAAPPDGTKGVPETPPAHQELPAPEHVDRPTLGTTSTPSGDGTAKKS